MSSGDKKATCRELMCDCVRYHINLRQTSEAIATGSQTAKSREWGCSRAVAYSRSGVNDMRTPEQVRPFPKAGPKKIQELKIVKR